MGNISKIATLIALITLAFSMSAIGVAMAAGKKSASANIVGPEVTGKAVMVITIFDNGEATVDKANPAFVAGVVEYGDQGLPDFSKLPSPHTNKSTLIKDIPARILWTNPCTWINMDGRWYYVCY